MNANLKETKASEKKLPAEFQNIEGYPYSYWLAADKEGYSRLVCWFPIQFCLCFTNLFDSIGLISKTKPLSIEFGFGLGEESAEHDTEGRLGNFLNVKPKIKQMQQCHKSTMKG